VHSKPEIKDWKSDEWSEYIEHNDELDDRCANDVSEKDRH